MTTARPAFYAARPGGWRDWWTILHPPYTAWHLSYVVVGATLAPRTDGGRLAATLLAFFLAVGLAAHALDELHGRPLHTHISSAALVTTAAIALAGAMVLGLLGIGRTGVGLVGFMIVGPVLVVGYNLEVFRGRLHSDIGFALAWGAFPVLTAYFVQAGRLDLTALLAAAAASALALAQRSLSTQAALRPASHHERRRNADIARREHRAVRRAGRAAADRTRTAVDDVVDGRARGRVARGAGLVTAFGTPGFCAFGTVMPKGRLCLRYGPELFARRRLMGVFRAQELAATIASFADTLDDNFDVSGFVQRLADKCVEVARVADAMVMLADDDGALVCVACTSEERCVHDLFAEQEQFERQGPSVWSFRTAAFAGARSTTSANGAGPRSCAAPGRPVSRAPGRFRCGSEPR